MNRNKEFYNAHHSPIGAFASFTLGYPGKSGGLGLELGEPANQNIYIGLERVDDYGFDVFPFCEKSIDETTNYDVESLDEEQQFKEVLRPLDPMKITRDYTLTTDTFTTDEIQFSIISPCQSIPDPTLVHDEEMKSVILPTVYVELSINNTKTQKSRKAFLGFEGNDPYSHMRHMFMKSTDKVGIGEGRRLAITTNDNEVKSALGFNVDIILSTKEERNWMGGLGNTGLLIMTIPPGVKKTYQFAISFYSGNDITTGMDMSYYYTKYFDSIEAVATYSLENMEKLINQYKAATDSLNLSDLNNERKWMLIHAIRSYYGSTQLLRHNGEPFWVVNEGEYRMMNTLDLTVDHLFYEMTMNPWVVKNTLNNFIKYYSYEDQCGISFTHDMGVNNVFSPQGYSAYEKFGLKGCFSHMTYEELLNWVLCALTYYIQTKDKNFLSEHLYILKRCLQSMVRRDDNEEKNRTGLMSINSSRCLTGSEITTYDSLDVSLGQSKNNVYIGGKTLAAYHLLDYVFSEAGLKKEAALAYLQGTKSAVTMTGSMDDQGYLPAVLKSDNKSRIIPAVEGLVYLGVNNRIEILERDSIFKAYYEILKKHIQRVLRTGVCLFEEGGYKLSSTSENSWLSKIYLNQYVIEDILKLTFNEQQGIEADKAHVRWLKEDANAYYAWSDQMVSGIARGSKYYPRGVTSILWLRLKR